MVKLILIILIGLNFYFLYKKAYFFFRASKNEQNFFVLLIRYCGPYIFLPIFYKHSDSFKTKVLKKKANKMLLFFYVSILFIFIYIYVFKEYWN